MTTKEEIEKHIRSLGSYVSVPFRWLSVHNEKVRTLNSEDKYLKGLKEKHPIEVVIEAADKIYQSYKEGPVYLSTGNNKPSVSLWDHIKVSGQPDCVATGVAITLTQLPEDGITVPNVPKRKSPRYIDLLNCTPEELKEVDELLAKTPPPVALPFGSLYISGPMRGIPKLNHEMFMDVTNRLRSLGYTVYNPAELDPSDDESIDNEEYKKRLKLALSLMLQAKYLVLLPGWEKSDGCLVELNCARSVGMPILFIDQLLRSY